MGGYVDKLRGRAGQLMGPGEEVRAALRTMPRGTVMGMGVGGVVGAAVAGSQAAKAHARQSEGTIAARWPMVRSAVGLTERRLLIFDYTLTGKPKDLVAEFPLDRVASLSVNRGVTNQVSFGFSDGSAVQVECAKLEKVGNFEKAFQEVKGTSLA
jgi:hypothetical protein